MTRTIPIFLAIFFLTLSAAVLPRPALAEESTGPLFLQRQASIQGIVVTETSAGMIGKAVDIIVTVTPQGNPETRFERKVGEQMTTSLNEAVRAVQVLHHDWDGKQLRVSFEDKYSAKDGGSAGSAYAVCFRSLLEDFAIDPDYAMTGDITVDQRVRQIGGVAAKIKGATVDGAKIVGIPAENVDGLNDLIILDTPQPLLETQVFTLETLDDAVALARTDRDPDLAMALNLFADLQETASRGGYRSLRNQESKDTLSLIVELAPNHASAQALLDYINKQGPRHLSVTASLNEILTRAQPAFFVMNQVRPGTPITDEQKRLIKEAQNDLREIRSQINPDVHDFNRAMNSYVSSAKVLITNRRAGNRHIEHYNKSLANLETAYQAVSEDAKMLEALIRGE
ncbi:MAG: S16 family serine protease [Planctomycetota bacterium]